MINSIICFFVHDAFKKLLLTLLLSFSSVAAYACSNLSGEINSNVMLQSGNFSAGQDMASGINVRVQRVMATNAQTLGCAGPTYLTFTTSGGTLYPGSTYIYQTGVAGLGVRFKSLRNAQYFGTNSTAGFSGTMGPYSFSFDMEFVVMGPISGGSVNTSAFPTLFINVVDGYGTTYTRATYNFSGGSFDIQTPTCLTPNYSYNLGQYGISNFSAGTQASPWMDAPITLTGCATFYGNNSNGSFTSTNQTGQSPSQSGTIASNTLTITLTPNTAIIDSAQGVVGLDSSSTATGVAFQVGSKQSGVYTPLNFNNGIVLTTTPGSTITSYTFPVAARIVRGTGTLSAGSVSTSFVYTVTYK